MAETQQTATFDAFFRAEDPYSSPVPTWFDVLNTEKNRKGLREISVQAYRGRAGYATLAALTVRMPDGSDAGADDTPTLSESEVGSIVEQAYDIAAAASKRDGYTIFRMLLRCVRKNRGSRSEVMADGEYATVSIDPVTGHVGMDPRIGEAHAGGKKDPRDALITSLVGHLDKILGTVTGHAQASQQVLLAAVELGDRLESRRHDIEERASEVATREHPEEQTKQFLAGLQFAAMEIDTLMKVYLMTKMGPETADAWARDREEKRQQWAQSQSGQGQQPNSGATFDFSATSSSTPHQDPVCRWYSNLDTSKRDALKTELGEDMAEAFYDGIHASAEDWPRCAKLLRRFIDQHATALISALGDDLRELCKLLGASMVA